MSTILDISRYHFLREKGDLTLIGTWIEIERRHVPCLVIVRTTDVGKESAVPCVITLDKAWIWSEDIGDMMQAAQILGGFLDALQLTPNKRDTYRVLSLIHDHLGDLISMPPWTPPDQRIVLGDVRMVGSDGTVRETELVHHV